LEVLVGFLVTEGKARFYCLKQIVQSNNATNKAKKETIKQAQHLDDGCGVAVMAAVGSERRGQIR